MASGRLPYDVPGLLVVPDPGASSLDVPADWRTWDHYFQLVRDAINIFASVADKVPHVELGRLPGGSLADLVIKPFCGDWDRIRANGTAGVAAADAMAGAAGNVAVTPLLLLGGWEGRAALAASVHVEGYALVTRGLAEVVRTARAGFAGLGRMSQEFGEAAIRIIVPLGKLLVRVARKIVSRLGGWVGWVRTATEVIANGLEEVRDIVEDIRRVIQLVRDLIELKHLVVEWVAEVRAQLAVLLELPEVVSGLPRLAGRVVS